MEEGVVFTSDNIFCQCHTWLQEADPDRWLETLDSMRALREDTFVPGHGPSATSGTSTSRARSSTSGWTTSAAPSGAA